MPKLPRVGSRDVIRVLERKGFHRGNVSSGSHQSYVKELEDGRRISVTVVQGKKELPPGTLRAILRRAEIAVEEFVESL